MTTLSCLVMLFNSVASFFIFLHDLANYFLLNVLDSLCIIAPFFFTRTVHRKLNYPFAFWRLSIVTDAIVLFLNRPTKNGAHLEHPIWKADENTGDSEQFRRYEYAYK